MIKNDNRRRFMQGLLHFITATLLIFGLVACNEEKHAGMSPLVSGVMHYKSKDASSVEKELSAEQLQKLSSWLLNHSEDWSMCLATPPAHTISIHLKHANGKSGTLRLLKYESSNGTLMASYLDGSNKQNEPCAFLTLTELEINDLHTLLSYEGKP